MTRLFLSILFSLYTIISGGQTKILGKYDFEKGGYYILGLRTESDRNGLADSLGEFYTDDISALNSIKKEWEFEKPSPKYACGYHYEIIVCRNGIALESFSVNLNCSEIVTHDGYFYFDPQKLRMFKNVFKRPFFKLEKFPALSEARTYRSNVMEKPKLIFTPTPDWMKYEGRFSFTYVCPKNVKNCFNQKEKLVTELLNEIKNTYPNEQFELEEIGGSKTELFMEITCNKTLSDKFSLYKRDLEFDNWEPFNFNFVTYWTEQPK